MPPNKSIFFSTPVSLRLTGVEKAKAKRLTPKSVNFFQDVTIAEVPRVNCQEATRKELRESLKVTLREALSFNKQDATAAAGDDYQEERIAA